MQRRRTDGANLCAVCIQQKKKIKKSKKNVDCSTEHCKIYIAHQILYHCIALKDTNEHNILTCGHFPLCEHRMKEHLDSLLTNTTILRLCHIYKNESTVKEIQTKREIISSTCIER